jgi:hypothetical protein
MPQEGVPGLILRKGVLYERSRHQGEGWRAMLPPRDCIGDKVSTTMRVTINRIVAAPGKVTLHPNFGGGRAKIVAMVGGCFHIPSDLAPVTITAMYRRGLIEPPPRAKTAKQKRQDHWPNDLPLVLSDRALALVQPRRVFFERIRWEAVRELGQENQKAWAAWRAQGCFGDAPPKQPRRREIRARMKEIVRRENPEVVTQAGSALQARAAYPFTI